MEDLLNSEPAWRQSMTAQINVFVNEVAQKTEDLIVAKMTEHLTAHGYDKQIEINGANLRACIERQIPKMIEEKMWVDTKCECGHVFSVHHGDGYHSVPYKNKTKHCPDCGQRLDWGNEQ